MTSTRTAYHITIEGRPCSENRRIGTRRFVLSDEYRAWKAAVGWSAVAQGVRQPIAGPVAVRIAYYHGGKGRAQDLTACCKATLDGLNGIAWNDDAQIVRLTLDRLEDTDRPRVEVWIEAAEVER